MKHETYQTIKQAYMGNADRPLLLKALIQESDPFVHRAINLAIQPTLFGCPWDVTPYTSNFKNADAKERLHQTVMTFLLRAISVVKEQHHFRTFGKPESHGAMQAWACLLKQCIFAVLTLLYNVRWNMELLFGLDEMILDMIQTGHASTLRLFMNKNLNIPVPITPAEQSIEKLNSLNIMQFGSSFWRLLHWIAEALDTREESPDILTARRVWLDLVTGPLYRLLGCRICMAHMREFVRDLKPQLQADSTKQRKLWFNIHNEVTATKLTQYPDMKTTIYSESDLEQDASFMRQAFDP